MATFVLWVAALWATALWVMPATAEKSASPSPVGRWLTIDDETQKPRAVVEITARQDALSGRIIRLIDPDEEDPRCEECQGPRKNQPIVGMEILWGLTKQGDGGNEWSGGRIVDPNNGKEYSCTISVVSGGNKLKVRGYIGITLLGRTQYWQRTR